MNEFVTGTRYQNKPHFEIPQYPIPAQRIARELVRVAKSLVAANDVFTVQKPIRFKQPYSTADCLYNARLILDAGYVLSYGVITYNTNKGDYETAAGFMRGSERAEYQFKGFSIGYSGEGSHGMMEFGKMFGWNFSEDGVFGRKWIDQADPGRVNLSQL